MSHNHLRRYRKRGALTQEEIAFLLGSTCGTSVSRYERAARPPSLETALAYQAIFGVPVHELFPRDYREAAGAVQDRAGQLARSLDRQRANRKAGFKQSLLVRAGTPVSPPNNHEHPKQ